MLGRIEADPIAHLGGHSPRLIKAYFSGYERALKYHSQGPIQGEPSLFQFSRWFVTHAFTGPQGWDSFCLLLTQTEEEALKLFFEFRKLAKKDLTILKPSPPATETEAFSILEFLKLDAIRKRPAMYFGNDQWLTQLWAVCNGYVEAERDLGIDSTDAQRMKEFETWLWERFPLAAGKNWGKLFQFLTLEVKEKALQLFFDNLELFLDGGGPSDNTKRFQAFLDEAVASALAEHERKKTT